MSEFFSSSSSVDLLEIVDRFSFGKKTVSISLLRNFMAIEKQKFKPSPGVVRNSMSL